MKSLLKKKLFIGLKRFEEKNVKKEPKLENAKNLFYFNTKNKFQFLRKIIFY
jgi:hypothetical protein